MRFIITALICLLCLVSDVLHAQQSNNSPGRFSGDLQFNGRTYRTDSALIKLYDDIGRTNPFASPLYESLKSSADIWLGLSYSKDGLDVGLRFDSFNNSGIFSGGSAAANGSGIGMWYVRKKLDKFTMQVGYIYDQFGSGTTFRSYENRGLAIDNPLVGLWARYDFTDNFFIKSFTGKQKNVAAFISPDARFMNLYDPFIKGINAEGYFKVAKKTTFAPGASLVNRTIDNNEMNRIAAEINQLELKNRFIPNYNTFAWSAYSTINVGRFNAYVEYAGKSEDVLRNLDSQLYNGTGKVLFGSLTYSQKGFGITAQAKKIQNFDFRTSPNAVATGSNGTIPGLLNFLPPQTRQNSLRLPARYASNTQVIDELAIQVDFTFTPKKGLTFNGNFSNVVSGDNLFPSGSSKKELLFREYYLDAEIRKRKSPLKALVGIQLIDYNIEVLLEKPGDGLVNTLTPFVELIYKIDRKKSVRAELQYMLTKRDYRLLGKNDPKPEKEQDFGDFAFGLIEFNIAPNYSFSVSDMYNVPFNIHFYDVSIFYTNKANRFGFGYARQPDGIVCTGGVCRFESAFSGFKASITSSF